MVFELFSRRNNKELKEDIYEYDLVPQSFRIQFAIIISGVVNGFKERHHTDSSRFWKKIVTEIEVEFGILSLEASLAYNKSNDYNLNSVMSFLLSTSNEKALDVMDLLVFYHYIYAQYNHDIKEKWQVAIDRINKKLKENSLGYEIVENQIVRIDNQFIHKEIVKESIKLLQDQNFNAVSQEFLKAHKHYKEENYKDAIVNAGKAFESTMKTICSKKGYLYDAQKDTASTLIRHLSDNKLIPSYMNNHIHGLKQALENSASVLRNKNGGHGQGDRIIEIDESIVRYTLNLCAANIVFLVERYKETQ